MSSIDLVELNNGFINSSEESKKRLREIYDEIQGDDQKSVMLKQAIKNMLNENNE
jgi:hypothetical protein